VRTRAGVAAAALVIVAAAGVPAPAAVNVIVSGVPGPTTGYVPPLVIVAQGAPVTFVNPDAVAPGGHDVVATSGSRPKSSAHWCSRPQFADAPCPLFWSEIIGPGESTPVLGFEDAVSGQTYGFRCTLHAGMVGQVLVA